MMVLPWSRLTRLLTFLLASTSIGSLVAHFYGLATMQWSVCFIALPSFLVLVAMWVVAQWRSNYPVAEMFVTGVLSGFVAACIYDLFRLPFVLLHLSHSLSVWALPIFKVFPCFGALILGEPQLQDSYSPIAHLLGWAYHFSNGIGFGLMYVSAVGKVLEPAR